MAPNSAPACNDHPGKTTCLGDCFRMTAVGPNSELTFWALMSAFTAADMAACAVGMPTPSCLPLPHQTVTPPCSCRSYEAHALRVRQTWTQSQILNTTSPSHAPMQQRQRALLVCWFGAAAVPAPKLRFGQARESALALPFDA